MSAEPAALLAWDSAFFGRRIGRVTAALRDAAGIAALERWADATTVDCLYLLVPCDALETVRLAEEAGFLLMDVRVTLGGELVTTPSTGAIRPARPTDIPALRAVAKASHQATRFYADPGFSKDRCDELYATWIEKLCADSATAVFVAESDGHPAGYVTTSLQGAAGHERGSIGLFAVAAAARGRGVGSALLGAAGAWFAARGAHAVEVVTQGRSIGAQRLYQRHGLQTAALELWYHRWRQRAS
jgi:dTDP-4-amino-4,6-dideoxy-D-galactose acyltransferase